MNNMTEEQINWANAVAVINDCKINWSNPEAPKLFVVSPTMSYKNAKKRVMAVLSRMASQNIDTSNWVY